MPPRNFEIFTVGRPNYSRKRRRRRYSVPFDKHPPYFRFPIHFTFPITLTFNLFEPIVAGTSGSGSRTFGVGRLGRPTFRTVVSFKSDVHGGGVVTTKNRSRFSSGERGDRVPGIPCVYGNPRVSVLPDEKLLENRLRFQLNTNFILWIIETPSESTRVCTLYNVF